MSTRGDRWQKYVEGFPWYTKWVYRFTLLRLHAIRSYFANKYLTGDGYEIGALTSPVAFVDPSVKVQYIDYLTRGESSEKCNVPYEHCVEVDIIADGNNLDSIESESAFFVISNHVLEHSPNPIGTVLEWLRVLRDGGKLFISVPHYKFNEFDFERNPVGLDHFVSDFKNFGVKDVQEIHVDEHVVLIDGIDKNNKKLFEDRKKEILKSNLHTHFHVFDKLSIVNMLSHVNYLQPIEVVDFFYNKYCFEIIFIVKKLDQPRGEALLIKRNYLFNCSVVIKNLLKLVLGRN